MTTANLAEALPRLQKLRKVTGDAVCVTLDVWLHRSGVDAEPAWHIWLARDQRNYEGHTLEAALLAAEYAANLIPTSGVPEVVLP